MTNEFPSFCVLNKDFKENNATGSKEMKNSQGTMRFEHINLSLLVLSTVIDKQIYTRSYSIF